MWMWLQVFIKYANLSLHWLLRFIDCFFHHSMAWNYFVWLLVFYWCQNYLLIIDFSNGLLKTMKRNYGRSIFVWCIKLTFWQNTAHLRVSSVFIIFLFVFVVFEFIIPSVLSVNSFLHSVMSKMVIFLDKCVRGLPKAGLASTKGCYLRSVWN